MELFLDLEDVQRKGNSIMKLNVLAAPLENILALEAIRQ